MYLNPGNLKKKVLHMVMFCYYFLCTDFLECVSLEYRNAWQVCSIQVFVFSRIQNLDDLWLRVGYSFRPFCIRQHKSIVRSRPVRQLAVCDIFEGIYIHMIKMQKYTSSSWRIWIIFGKKLRRTPAFSFLQFYYELVITVFLSFHILF